MDTQKGFVSLIPLIIGFIILVGIGGYVVFVKRYQIPTATITPSPATSSNKQTYRNNLFGIEFLYPKDWFIFDSNEGDIQVLYIYPKSAQSNMVKSSYVHMAFIPNREINFVWVPGPTIEDYEKMFSVSSMTCNNSPVFDNYEEIKNYRLMKIGDQNNLLFEYLDNNKWEQAAWIATPENKNFFGFIIGMTTINDTNLSSIFNEIISSLQLLK